MSYNQEVAHTILNQLGGQRFIAMTGAKKFSAGDECLNFWIPLKNGINNVNIALDVNDTYRMTFNKWNAKKLENRLVYTVANVYWDQLQDIFTEQTGLYTKL
jgi:hypothetical protein